MWQKKGRLQRSPACPIWHLEQWCHPQGVDLGEKTTMEEVWATRGVNVKRVGSPSLGFARGIIIGVEGWGPPMRGRELGREDGGAQDSGPVKGAGPGRPGGRVVLVGGALGWSEMEEPGVALVWRLGELQWGGRPVSQRVPKAPQLRALQR